MTEQTDTRTMTAEETEALDELREAVKSWHVRFEVVRAFSGNEGVQVWTKPVGGRWAKVGRIVFHPSGKLADALELLATMRADQ